MIISKPPNVILSDSLTKTLFLAGSIEQGKAELWQDTVIAALNSVDIVYNPRRDNWDVSWVNSVDNPMFATQVEWELAMIDVASLVFFYFDPKTTSPISLLELGLTLGSEKNIIVVCPDRFYRKGNVQITCDKYNVDVLNTLEEGIAAINQYFNSYDFSL